MFFINNFLVSLVVLFDEPILIFAKNCMHMKFRIIK